MDRAGVLAAAPFENDRRGEREILDAGVVYLFKGYDNPSSPLRIVGWNAGDGDGDVPFDIVPKSFQGAEEPWGSVAVAMTDELLVVGVAGESSADAAGESKGAAPVAGAVYIYDRALGTLVGYLKAPVPRVRDLFGYDVAITDAWLAVSAPGDDERQPDSGVVYMYRRKDALLGAGRVELPPERIKAPVATESSFLGRSIALEADVLVVGAPLAASVADPSTGSGRVFVYRHTDGRWTREAELEPPFPTQGALFGLSVAISGDRIAVGSPAARACSPHEEQREWRGAAYVVSRQGGTWSLGPCMTARTGGASTGFGGSVALLGDQLAIGATYDANGLPGAASERLLFSGAAYLYESSDGLGFRETAYLKAPNARSKDLFGYPVALAPGLLVVGAPGQSGKQLSVEAAPELDPADASGAAYVFSVPAR